MIPRRCGEACGLLHAATMKAGIALSGIAFALAACSSSGERSAAMSSGTGATRSVDGGSAGGAGGGTGGTQSAGGSTQSASGGTQSASGGTQSANGGTQSASGGTHSGNGGTSGSGGGTGSGGASGGASGAGGASGGAGGSGGSSSSADECQDTVNGPSRVTFDISLGNGLTPDQICVDTCTGYSVSVKDAKGATLKPGLPDFCTTTPCSTCASRACPGSNPPVCTRMSFSSSYATYLWTGSYYTTGSCSACTSPGCGPALACQDYACAPDGHYTATLCLPRTMPGTGSTCMQSSQQACATVEFDLPGIKNIPVVLE